MEQIFSERMVRSSGYYSFWVFNIQSNTPRKIKLWKATTRAYKSSKKTPYETVNRRNSVFSLVIQRCIQQKLRMKNIKFLLVCSTPPTYSPDFVSRDFHIFYSLQSIFCWRSGENVCENVLEFETSSIFLEWNQNNGKYTTNWNKFNVEVFMKKLYLTKIEIIYDSTQYILTG